MHKLLDKVRNFFNPKGFTYVNSKGNRKYLNMKMVTLRGGKKHPVYYFSSEFRPETSQASLPKEYEVCENSRNGFLTIKRAGS